MKKIVSIFGVIAGAIPMIGFYLVNPSGENIMGGENGMLIGYATMVLALSTIFFAVKQYRDKYNDGQVKFGKAFLIGLYISLIASVIYATGWEVYTTTLDVNFAEQYQEYTETALKSSGMSELEIQAEIESNAEMMEMYENNLFFRFGITMTEILPVGIVISLITALLFSVIMKKKEAAIA